VDEGAAGVPEGVADGLEESPPVGLEEEELPVVV